MIKITDLVKVYRTEEVETTALNKLSLEVKKGEFVSIMGASGCGKSTLLNIIGLLDAPNNGSYLFDGREVATFNEKQRAGLRKANIGFVFQNFQLIPSLTALENIMVPLELRGDTTAKIKALKQIEAVGLLDRQDHYPTQLSGGEQQRVAIARAFVTNPAVLFADEPTGNLDDDTGGAIEDLLFQMNKDHGTTLIIVTHDMELAKKTNRIIRLKSGKIASDKFTKDLAEA